MALAILGALLAACGGSACEEGFTCKEVKASDYPGTWPLQVASGTLACKPVEIVTFTTEDGTVYAVNNSAVMTNLYADIAPVLILPTGDPGPLRTDGLKLCSGGA